MQMPGMRMPPMLPTMPPRLPMAFMPQLPARMSAPTLNRLPLASLAVRPEMQGSADAQSNKNLPASMLRTQAFTPIKEEVLNTALETMKMPVTKENTFLAKTMVQSGVPLTQENMKELKTALANLPSVKPSDMQAASFLKSAALMPTPQNITVLSNFIATNPQLGACFFEISREFRKINDNKKGTISTDRMAIMSKTSKVMGELIMDPKGKGSAGNAKAFQKMAGQAGIQLPNYMMGSYDEELSSLMEELRKVLYGGEEADAQLTKELENLVRKTENTIAAQRLINGGLREGKDNFYYIQIPLRIGESDFTAELKLFYTTDYEGRKVIDGNNFEFELLVPSVNIGESHFHIKSTDGIIDAKVSMDAPEYAQFMNAYLPLLAERISLLGYSANNFNAYAGEGDKSSLAIETESFETMEALDLSY